MALGDVVLGFFRPMWLVHHVWGHHSFTGVDKLDPDVANGQPFARKSFDTKWKSIYTYQYISSYLLFLVLPGQWFGQVVQYYRSIIKLSFGPKRARIFGTPLKPAEAVLKETALFSMAAVFVAVALVVLHGPAFAFYSLAAFSAARSFTYWAIVFPNHEVLETGWQPRAFDWGEQQIRHSANFRLPRLLTSIIGGMNYQTEHHLFPAVHPDHYPALSEIVRKECAKRNVPYNDSGSWFNALISNFKMNIAWAKSGKQTSKFVH